MYAPCSLECDADILCKGHLRYAVFVCGHKIMLMYGKEASNRKQETDRQQHTHSFIFLYEYIVELWNNGDNNNAEEALLKDKWSIECHYSALNDTSIENDRAKMYGNSERR